MDDCRDMTKIHEIAIKPLTNKNLPDDGAPLVLFGKSWSGFNMLVLMPLGRKWCEGLAGGRADERLFKGSSRSLSKGVTENRKF